jgi:signal transduction histidine kinase
MGTNGSHISGTAIVFSSIRPGIVQRRSAFIFALAIIVSFFALVGISDNQPHLIPGFVLAFVVSMLVCDIITAVLLFAQYSMLRVPAILLLANGYVFTALILIGWTLTFPDVFTRGESLVGGLQSASGFYIAWRSGFSAFVIAYVLLKETRFHRPLERPAVRTAIYSSLIVTTVAAAAIALICIAGEPYLPRIMADRLHYSSLYPYTVGLSNCSLSILAIFLLWRRGVSTLDLWLLVVMFFYAMDFPLSYYPSPTRFTDGWYAVRFIAFISSTLVLILLLCEITNMYERLINAIDAQRREREARIATGDAVAAMIAHEVKQPLTAMINRAQTSFLWLDRATPEIEKAKSAIKLIASDGHRAGAIIDTIRANFQKDMRTRVPCDVNDLVSETISFVRGDLQRHQIGVQIAPHSTKPIVVGDRVQLQQLLLNLINNAIDAMAEKHEPRILAVTTQVRDDSSVMIEVSDTGSGISLEDVDRLFDPFFTTKSNGMGMGLSICRSILDAHAGELSIVPNVPEGTIFQVILPCAE